MGDYNYKVFAYSNDPDAINALKTRVEKAGLIGNHFFKCDIFASCHGNGTQRLVLDTSTNVLGYAKAWPEGELFLHEAAKAIPDLIIEFTAIDLDDNEENFEVMQFHGDMFRSITSDEMPGIFVLLENTRWVPFDQRMRTYTKAFFVSDWECGSRVQTSCKVDTKNREVFDIERLDGVYINSNLVREYIILGTTEELVAQVDDGEEIPATGYWYKN